MKQIWDGTLSPAAYRGALSALKTDFPTHYLIHEIPQILSQIHRPKILIRHNIAGSLARAWDMARLEYELGYRASYMIQGDSPRMDLTHTGSIGILHKIRELGHEIGLFMVLPETPHSLEELERRVDEAGARLQNLLDFPVFSVAFSSQVPGIPEDSQFVGSKINATAPLMMRWTLEDSQPLWVIEPPRAAGDDPTRALLQVIVRPDIWSFEQP